LVITCTRRLRSVLLDQRTHLLDRVGDHVLEVELAKLEFDLAAGDARDVQQIVDQRRHVAGLARDDLAGALHHRGIDIEVREHGRGRDDRRQRIAQFMRQHGQELVLALVGFAQRRDQVVLLRHRLAQLDLAHDLVRHRGQHELFLLAQALRPGTVVQHAQGAERDPVAGLEQGAGVEPQPGPAGDQQIAAKARIVQGIGHDHLLLFEQRMATDRVVQRHLARAQADLGLEPLAAARDQVDRGDRRIEELADQAHDVIERTLRRRIEDAVGIEDGEAGFLVEDGGAGRHGCLGFEWDTRARSNNGGTIVVNRR
jgi:hypothetical protein